MIEMTQLTGLIWLMESIQRTVLERDIAMRHIEVKGRTEGEETVRHKL